METENDNQNENRNVFHQKKIIIYNLNLQETDEGNSKSLITIENANFSNKKCLLNSPRSLQACFQLGIDPSELYQMTMDEFKLLNPDVRHLPQDMLQYRYDAEEKYRTESINQVKELRKKIIEEDNKKVDEEKDEKKEEENKNELDEKMKKKKEEE